MKISNLCFSLLLATIPSVSGNARDTVDVSDRTYIVVFSDTISGTDTSRCIGTIIGVDSIITSAQCAEMQLPYARLGYQDDTSNAVGVANVTLRVNYPGWSPNHNNRAIDIAIVFVDTLINATFIAGNPSFSTKTYDISDNGDTLLLISAGAISEGGPTATSLRGEEIVTSDFKQCAKEYRTTNPRVVLREDTQFCAGGIESPDDGRIAAGACSQGDQGAPVVLVNEDGSGDTLYGFASFGNAGCAKGDTNFIYVRFPFFFDWATEQICEFSQSQDTTGCPTPSPGEPTRAPTAPTPSPLEGIDFFTILSYTSNEGEVHRFGGVLIHEDIVLTASGFPQVGDNVSVGYSTDDFSVAFRTVAAVVNHPRDLMNDSNDNIQEYWPNDLSVVKLDAPVPNITQITLNADKNVPQENNRTAFFAHAGILADQETPFVQGVAVTGGVYATSVQTGEVGTIPFSQCAKTYREHRISNAQGYKSDFDGDIQLCAAASVDGIGPCDGAAWGSPLWVEDDTDGSPILVGIASQGTCTTALPFIYTRISAYTTNFINVQICNLSDNPPDDCPTG